MHQHGIAAHHQGAHGHILIIGLSISAYSRHIVHMLAAGAKLSQVHITSVHRTVPDQARIFFQKHVVELKAANYKNPRVADIVAHARAMHARGSSDQDVQVYFVSAIEHAHGGPESISRHLLHSPFLEVFDVAHYSGPTTGLSRHNYMSDTQAHAFLRGCRDLIPVPINRLGHSEELGIAVPQREFVDEKCFHLEIVQPLFDRLEVSSPTMLA